MRSLPGPVAGLAAAALFGASAPLAKLLVARVPAVLLAGLLYLGAGLALALVGAVRARVAPTREAPLDRRDRLTLLAITALGGVVAPVLLVVGLARVSGLAAALLLNLEAPATIAIAVLVFREHLGARGALAIAAIVGGGGLLVWRPGALHADLAGVAAIGAACVVWGVDNNLTQRLSLKDPIAIVRAKTLGAACCTIPVALVHGATWPGAGVIAASIVLGAFSYGVSLLLDVYALRRLGAAREAAYFATAPFLGAALAVPLLGERLGPVELGGAALMAVGVALLLRERHAHVHTHEELEHDHLHTHDDGHHDHDHAEPLVGPHAHVHRHAAVRHDHPHVPDLHHRHRH